MCVAGLVVMFESKKKISYLALKNSCYLILHGIKCWLSYHDCTNIFFDIIKSFSLSHYFNQHRSSYLVNYF